MNDRLIDAIRRADPFPDEIPGPPVEVLLRRLREDGADPDPPAAGSRRPSPALLMAVASGAVALVVAVLALVLLGRAHPAGRPAGGPAGATAVRACRSDVHDGVLPPWARAGFSQPRPRLAYAVGASDRIAAILFAARDPLYSPPAAERRNKILWVSRVPTGGGHELRIHAQRMTGSRRLGAPVTRVVSGGPGPSIINLPAPGCWRLTLRWSGWTDQLDLRYNRPG